MKILKITLPGHGQYHVPLEVVEQIYGQVPQTVDYDTLKPYLVKDKLTTITDLSSAELEVVDKHFIVPTNCPKCYHKLSIVTNSESGSTGLFCVNDDCKGKSVKKLEKGIGQLKIKGIGGATCEKLNLAGIEKIEDIFDKTKFNRMKLIDSGEFKQGKTLNTIVNSVDKIVAIDLKKIINSLNITDVGDSVSEALAKHMAGQDVDFFGLNKEAVRIMTDPNSKERQRLDSYIELIKSNDIEIIMPKVHSTETIFFEMTGAPPSYMGKKGDFKLTIEQYGYVHHKLNKNVDVILVTDNLESTTGKMAKAKKLGKEIYTYEQIYQKLNLHE